MNKLYPLNSHQAYYSDWLYLGNDSKQDYYYKKSKYAHNRSGIWLSIVFSNNPSDYGSPDYDNLKSNKEWYLVNSDKLKGYKTLITLLENNNLL